MPPLIDRLLSIGRDRDDDADTRVKKRFLLAFTLMVIPAAALWGALYWSYDERLAAAIPLGYAVLSVISTGC